MDSPEKDAAKASTDEPSRRLERLPQGLVDQFKWLCYRAAVCGAFVSREKLPEAASEACVCLVHGIAIKLAECDGLRPRTRELLQALAWAAMPALVDEAGRERFEELQQELHKTTDLAAGLRDNLIEVATSAAGYVLETQPPGSRLHQAHDPGMGWACLTRLVWASWRCYWERRPWRGANLGGWLLLEPGPSHQLWESERRGGDDGGGEAQDEHTFCSRLGDRCEDVIQAHRKSWLQEHDFQYLSDKGFNAVRIPFGYWVVTGSTHGDVYAGAALDVLDHALDLAERFGFQVLLDLHGNPGGESGSKPCGRENGDWTEASWRRDESLRVLKVIAERYVGRKCVAGLQVANEPDKDSNMATLCDFYEQAIQVVREAGMEAGQVAVVVPVHECDRLEDFLRIWIPRGNFLRYDNVALDVHIYHCFGPKWDSLSHRGHLLVAQRHGQVLRSVPCAVVGEWSLARPSNFVASDEMEREYATGQLDAYASASHGWFFWTYSDRAQQWDLQHCFKSGWLQPCQWRQNHERSEEESTALLPRIPPPGRFPRCYGLEHFSRPSHQGASPSPSPRMGYVARPPRKCSEMSEACCSDGRQCKEASEDTAALPAAEVNGSSRKRPREDGDASA